MLNNESALDPHAHPSQPLAGLTSTRDPESNSAEHNSVLFKDNRMYRHNIARFNYTTYDVRRAQDVVNPRTSRCDILLLAKPGGNDANSGHPFLYARVLGIYHVNVIYVGKDALDYQPREVYFLWVRWFEYFGSASVRWDDLKLDSVRFPPMATEGSFGFVDPGDVLRGCHIIPAFRRGRVHSDGIGLSGIAKDGHDWSRYCVMRYVILSWSPSLFNCILIPRFVDPDLMMRYHWGLGIGHVYGTLQGSTGTGSSIIIAQTSSDEPEPEPEPELEPAPELVVAELEDESDNNNNDSLAELGLRNVEDDDLGESEEGLTESEAEDDEACDG